MQPSVATRYFSLWQWGTVTQFNIGVALRNAANHAIVFFSLSTQPTFGTFAIYICWLCSQYLILPPYILPAISWKQCKTTRSSHCWQLFYRASTVGNFIILAKHSWLFKYFIVEFFIVFLLSLLCISLYNSLRKYKSHILYLLICMPITLSYNDLLGLHFVKNNICGYYHCRIASEIHDKIFSHDFLLRI